MAPEDSTCAGRRPLAPGPACEHRALPRTLSRVTRGARPPVWSAQPRPAAGRGRRCPLGPCEAARAGRSGSAGHVRRSHSRLLAPRGASRSGGPMYLSPSVTGSAPSHRDGGSWTRAPTSSICAVSGAFRFCFRRVGTYHLFSASDAGGRVTPPTQSRPPGPAGARCKQLLTFGAVTKP